MRKQRNILLLHLESISRANLWQYRNELGTVWRLMSESLQFNRFYTNSTSTAMSQVDVMYGDSSVRDASPTFNGSRVKLTDYSRFVDFVQEPPLRHYLRFIFTANPYARRRELVSDGGVGLNEPDSLLMCQKALSHIKKAHEAGKSFFAYFWDGSSHLAYPCQQKDRVESIPDRLRVGYSLVDRSTNHLLAGLANLGIWDETIIVGFGDHGDEPWSHGLNRGYAHALVPYASQCWTPMFIYHPTVVSPGIDSRLVSAVDIKPTTVGMVFPEEPPVPERTMFAGVDIFKKNREFAFSQNMFALQRELSDPEKGMTKGYAVTDGRYRLVAKSGGDNVEAGGVELYCDQADPANSLDLLRFFERSPAAKIVRFRPPQDAVAEHFFAVFGESQVESVIAAYNKLHPILCDHIKNKNEQAMKEYEAIMASSVEMLAKKASHDVEAYCGAVYSEEFLAPYAAKAKAMNDAEPIQIFPLNVLATAKRKRRA